MADTKHDEPMKGLELSIDTLTGANGEKHFQVRCLMDHCSFTICQPRESRLDAVSLRRTFEDALRSVIATEVEASRPAPAQAHSKSEYKRRVALGDETVTLPRAEEGVASPPAIYEQRLRAVLAALLRYLPPGGTSAHDTLSEIIGLVDPWPTAESSQGQREVVAPGAAQGDELPREFWDLLHEWGSSLDEERRDWIEHRFGQLFANASRPALNEIRAAIHGAQAPSEAAGAAQPVAWEDMANSFYMHIAHGDEKHREWLKTETVAWFRGRHHLFNRTAVPEGWRDPEQLARRFHDTYERLAPQFGYTTRDDTKQFDPDSPNGKLMIAVCAALNREVEPRTVRMPLKEEQIEAIWMSYALASAERVDQTMQVQFARLIERAHGINSGTKGESK